MSSQKSGTKMAYYLLENKPHDSGKYILFISGAVTYLRNKSQPPKTCFHSRRDFAHTHFTSLAHRPGTRMS
jgi:hypothetical protein